VCGALTLAAACGGGSSDAAPSARTGTGSLPPGDDTTVERLVDGDTLWVDGRERVRLIGIDTPETQHPSRGVECFGKKAGAFLGRLVPAGTDVRLVYDVERQDRYGRTLAYLYRTSDGLFVNAEMVGKGYAQAYTVPPNVAHVDELVALQAEARESGRGLWSACADTPTSSAPSGTAPDAGCDASYPGVCIPSPPPDLDCSDVEERAFRVERDDPHNFDGDGNRLGCEQGR
jgi:micrococcal nuclease